MPVAEYAPLSIKSAVVGYGLAAKEQVQFMVTRLLELDSAPESPDAADALAIAICHIQTAQTLRLQGARGEVRGWGGVGAALFCLGRANSCVASDGVLKRGWRSRPMFRRGRQAR